MQNEITSRIAIALNFALTGAEAARPSVDPDALDYFFRARAVMINSPSHDSYAEAIGLYERSLALAPQSAWTKLYLVNALTARILNGMSNAAAADLARSESLLGQAMALLPDNPLAHSVKGQVLRARRRYADAIPEYEAAIALDRNWVGAYANLGQCKLYTGALEEVIPLVEQSIRLSPHDSNLGYWYRTIAEVQLLQSRTDEAILWLEKARSANPAHPFIRATLASAYGLKGETERAAARLAKARKLSGDPSGFSSIAHCGPGRSEMAWRRRPAPYTKPSMTPACAGLGYRRNDNKSRDLLADTGGGCATVELSGFPPKQPF